MYNYIVDANFLHVLIRNNSAYPLAVHEGIRLRTVTECNIKGAYLIEPKEYGLTAISPARIPDLELKTYYYNRVTIYREP